MILTRYVLIDKKQVYKKFHYQVFMSKRQSRMKKSWPKMSFMSLATCFPMIHQISEHKTFKLMHNICTYKHKDLHPNTEAQAYTQTQREDL